MKKKKENKKKRVMVFVNEFKTFISRGSVMDLAVGMIIGASFTAIVNSLAGDIVTPLLGLIIGGIDFSGLALNINGLFENNTVSLTYGNFIQSVISFLAIAFCVFMIIKVVNKLKDSIIKREEEEKKADEPSADEKQIALLKEIRDLLKKAE